MQQVETADADRLTERSDTTRRIAVLDVLRGIAITCILFMNIPYVASYATLDFFDPRLAGWTMLDQWAFGANFLIEGTMRGLLQLLFGAGMMIALRRVMQPDGPVAVLDSYMRRNLLLMLFGLAHALLLMWPGDILLVYGLAALFLPPCRMLQPSAKFLLGAAIVIAMSVGGTLPPFFENARNAELVAEARVETAAGRAPTTEQTAAIEAQQQRVNARSLPPTGEKAEAMQKEEAGRQGGLAGFWRFSVEAWFALNFKQGGFFYIVPETFAGMLVGAALFGWGIIQGQRSTGFYVRLLLACYAFGAIARLAALDRFLEFAVVSGDVQRLLIFIASDLARLPIAVGHIALVMLLWRSARTAWLVRPFAANGKLPLSTYFSATIATALIFPAFAFDQWGKHGFAAQQGIAILIIAVQLVLANLWLRSHVTGPPEWLWKSLTYERRQPWRRDAPGGG